MLVSFPRCHLCDIVKRWKYLDKKKSTKVRFVKATSISNVFHRPTGSRDRVQFVIVSYYGQCCRLITLWKNYRYELCLSVSSRYASSNRFNLKLNGQTSSASRQASGCGAAECGGVLQKQCSAVVCCVLAGCRVPWGGRESGGRQGRWLSGPRLRYLQLPFRPMHRNPHSTPQLASLTPARLSAIPKLEFSANLKLKIKEVFAVPLPSLWKNLELEQNSTNWIDRDVGTLVGKKNNECFVGT